MFESIQQAQQDFAVAADMQTLTACVRAQSQRLGFGSFVYALRVPTNFSNAQIIMVDGYPEGWVKRYFEEAYFDVDPVMAWCLKSIPCRCAGVIWYSSPAVRRSA